MKITVKIIKENKDGSANAQVDFDKDGLETLVQWGLVAMLKQLMNTKLDQMKLKYLFNPSLEFGQPKRSLWRKRKSK